MEREVGGGLGMGNTCKPMAVSFQCMTKFTTNKKKEKKKNSGKDKQLRGENEISTIELMKEMEEKKTF